MASFPGVYLTIILLHMLPWMGGIKTKVAIQGLIFISYPLTGLLANIKLTCYQMMSG